MDNTESNFISALFWVLIRLICLNALVLGTVLFLAIARSVVESTGFWPIKFPFHLFLVAFFLSNLVYIVGIGLELIYLRLWDKKLDVKSFERKFFRIGLVVLVMVSLAGVVLYFI